MTVTPGLSAPYVYDGRPFLRSQSTIIRMPRERVEQLLCSRKPAEISWEKLTTNQCTMADLDKERIQQVVNIAVSQKRLVEIAVRTAPSAFIQ